MLYESPEAIIKLFNDYFSIIYEANYITKPMALAQVESGSTSKTFLNEIRQIIYSLYIAKKITRKVYNNFMSSIKV